jgi:flagellar biosynthetic protein FliR
VSLEIDPRWAFSVFLLSVRLGVFLAMTPILSGSSVPAPIRVLLVLGLTLFTVSALNVAPIAVPAEIGQLLLAVLTEVAVGAVLAFGIFAAFAAFSVAGTLLDIQIGFGLGTVFDPVTRRQTPVLATAFDLLAVTAFFAMDGHHALMRGIGYSLQQLPPGAFVASLSVTPVVKQFGVMFSLGIALVAPAVFCVFLAEIGLAMLSRVMPQMNIFVLGIPVKIFVGLSVLVLSMAYLAPVMGKIFLCIFRYWEEVIG